MTAQDNTDEKTLLEVANVLRYFVPKRRLGDEELKRLLGRTLQGGHELSSSVLRVLDNPKNLAVVKDALELNNADFREKLRSAGVTDEP